MALGPKNYLIQEDISVCLHLLASLQVHLTVVFLVCVVNSIFLLL